MATSGALLKVHLGALGSKGEIVITVKEVVVVVVVVVIVEQQH